MDSVSNPSEANVIKYRNILAVALVTLAAIGLLASCQKASSLADRQNCKQQLRSLWSAIALYRSDHSNQWPPNLESLDKDILDHLLTCPGAARTSAPQVTNVVGQSDYFYIDWSKLPQEPSAASDKYPLIYDRRLSNHGGQGINILMVNAAVEWDANIEWLKKFAAEHPNAKLPMPE